MKALIMTRSPKVMRPATTPSVARQSMATRAAAMMSCCPVLSTDKVVWALSRARRKRSRLSSYRLASKRSLPKYLTVS